MTDAAPLGTTVGQAGDAPFDHIGLMYRSADDFLTGTVPFVRTAVRAGRPVLAALPPRNLDLLRAELGADGDAVRFTDITVTGRNPGNIIPGVLLAFADRHPGRRVSIVGEPVWPGRSTVEYPACVAQEALVNLAFAGRDAEILCPFDVAGLGPHAVTDMHGTHPSVVRDGRHQANDAYREGETSALARAPLAPPPADAAVIGFRLATDLPGVRSFMRRHAQAAALDADSTGDLVIAVNELAANTAEHTGDGGTLAVWTEHDALVCQVEDTGYLADPLVGATPAAVSSARGRGLLLVHSLCHLVRVHTRPGRTAIRLYTYLRRRSAPAPR